MSAATLSAWYLVPFQTRSTKRSRPVTVGSPRTRLADRVKQVMIELRVVMPGTQALLGFQLVGALQDGFDALPATSKWVHLVGLGFLVLSVVLLMLPAAFHRIAERGEITERLHRVSSRTLLAAMAALAFGIGCDVYVVARKTLQSTALPEPRTFLRDPVVPWCGRSSPGWRAKIESARRSVIGDVELFLGPVVEPWDLGMMPKPANAPLRFISMHKLDEAAATRPPSPELMAQMDALIDEMTKAGVLQTTGGLGSTKDGMRIRFDGGKRSVIDGPFAESKELVAGYAIIDLPSKESAVDWATRFGELVKVNEVEVRPVCE